jgi:hypothetical protein
MTDHSTTTTPDLVRRLRFLVSLNDPDRGGPYGGTAAEQCMRAMCDAADALEQLSAPVSVDATNGPPPAR